MSTEYVDVIRATGNDYIRVLRPKAKVIRPVWRSVVKHVLTRLFRRVEDRVLDRAWDRVINEVSR